MKFQSSRTTTNFDSNVVLNAANLHSQHCTSKQLSLASRTSASDTFQNFHSQHCTTDQFSLYSRSSGLNTFTVMNCNIRSIAKNLDKLIDLLCCLKLSPNLITLSETWHNSSSYFIPSFPNYTFISSSYSCN